MSTALQPRAGSYIATDTQWGMSRDQVDLIKRTIAKGVTDDELALFLSTAQRMQLDPFAKQIYAVKRFDRKENREVMSIQVSIDGYRVCAMRSGEMDGEDGPWWCGDDGIWVDAWLHEQAPRAAKIAVYRKGCARPFVGVASYDSYVQLKDGKPNSMWERGPDFMLAKCAEAVAKRRAFPLELGGTVTSDEVGDEALEAEFRTVDTATPVVQPRVLPSPSKPTIMPNSQPDTTTRTASEPVPVTTQPVPPVPAHAAERKATEDAAREEALAKARENAAELERARIARAAAPPAGPVTPTGELTEDEIQVLVHDMYKAPHLGALKTIAHGISKRKLTKEQGSHLDKVYAACEKTLKAKATAEQGAA